jgi:hypothetical protein
VLSKEGVVVVSQVELDANEGANSKSDVYDGQVCWWSSPCQPPQAGGLLPCEGESWKATPSPEPSIFGAPASQIFKGPGNPPPPAPAKAKARTKAQLLEKAVADCKKKQNKKKRQACEATARKRYGAIKKKAKKASQGLGESLVSKLNILNQWPAG